MNRVVLVLVMGSFLLSVGCAKKQKPDVDNTFSSAFSKDMSFDPSGSDSGKIEGLYTVHFDYDKSNLSKEDRNILVKNADWLKHHMNKSFQIEGHCDRHGSTEYNLGLGQKRADIAKQYLVNLGIKADRIITTSYGKEQLLDDAETEAADAKNRRANFKPIDKPIINRLSNL
jgi:peptidoglycan-associated lipoprotein